MDFQKLNELCKNINDSTRALITSREKIEGIKRDVLTVVESLLESQVSEDTLISSCQSLSQSDYSDVIEERNILGICGYPLCDKKVKTSSQKYHISCTAKKVYDITERKCFCSNKCFKASKYLKLQLNPEPTFLQFETVNVQLLSDMENRGSEGEEIRFESMNRHIDCQPITEQRSNNDVESLLLGEISECALKFKELIVRENEQADVLQSKDSFVEEECIDQDPEQVNHNVSDTEYENLDNDDCIDYKSLDYEKTDPITREANGSISHCEHPSIMRKSKYGPAVLIEALPMKVSSTRKCIKTGVPLPTIRKALRNWMTLQSLEVLLGKDHVQAAQSRCFEEFLITESKDDDHSKILQGIEKLCLKIDVLEKEEDDMDKVLLKQSSDESSQSLNMNKKSDFEECSSVKIPTILQSDKSCSTKLPVRRPHPVRRKRIVDAHNQLTETDTGRDPKQKAVRFSPDTKKDNKDEANGNTRESTLPLVDSMSQAAIQQHIVAGHLKIAFGHLLPFVGLHYKCISKDLRTLLSTFEFSAHNITFPKSAWNSMAFVLLRMLEKVTHRCEESLFCEILSKATFNVDSLAAVDQLIADVTNVDDYLKS